MTDLSNNQIIDISGNQAKILEEQERRRKFIMEKREKQKLYLRDLVMRQTDYDEETAVQKLEEFKGDVMAIVREYMGPAKKVEQNTPTSTNQVIMKEIRTMMDDAAAKYRIKKDLEERKKLFIEQMENQRKEAAKKLEDKLNE